MFTHLFLFTRDFFIIQTDIEKTCTCKKWYIYIIAYMSPFTSGGTRSMVISCPHTDALFVIQCFNHCCCRRQKHLAWESHSTICWVTSKEFHLLRRKHTLFSRQQVKIPKYINYVNQTLLLCWKQPQNPWQISKTLTWICCPTSNPSAVGCLIWKLIYNLLLFKKICYLTCSLCYCTFSPLTQMFTDLPSCGPTENCAAVQESC